MKKSLFLIAAVLFLTACGDSTEEKAEKLAKKALNGVIVNIETYEPIETKVDSAFAPLMTPETFEFYAQMPSQMRTYASWQEEAAHAKRTMSIYGSSHYSYDMERYQRASEDYEMYSQKIAQYEEKLQKFFQKMEQYSKEEPVFSGYKVRHKFRFVNNEGQKSIGEYMFFMNKDLTAVESMIDLEDEFIKAMVQRAEMQELGK